MYSTHFRLRRPEHDLSVFQGDETCRDTWAGPIKTEMYGTALQDLCLRTEQNLNRLSNQMERIDSCLEFDSRYWHARKRPASAGSRIQRKQGEAKWENLDVMFTDYDSTKNLSSNFDEGKGDYIDPPVPVNRFCYLCSTMQEHKKHLLHHKPAKRPSSAKPRLRYIAPKPKVKKKIEEEEEIVVKERLYKVEVFTSDIPNAGTSANVFITIKGSLELLPRTQLVKKRGCANFCFVRASKEVFHLMGPLLGNLQTLTIEHDGRKKFQGWHLEKIEVTDVKALKTWVFNCGEWLSMFEKPHYTNIMDLKAEEKHMPLAEYNIEVYTGKKQMAGTDANIYIVISGENGTSRKVHLADNTKDKKLFEKNSVDKFRIRMHSLGNLQKIRIEHDGKGMGAGWFLDRIIIKDSTRPKDTFYFLYNGWIAKDEGEGKLWREIKAKKVLPKEVLHVKGIKTQYNISVKTSDIRYAGTDANVFIQIAGVNGGITPKLKLDDAKNNFERNMVDNFEVQAVNVGVIDHIVIGHDNFGPGAGWHLESVTIRRYIPKDEAKERVKKVKKRLKKEKKLSNVKNRRSNNSDYDSDDVESHLKQKQYGDKRGTKEKARRKRDKNETRDLFSVSSESSDGESDMIKESRGRKEMRSRRPSSALRRQSESSGERKSPILERSDSRRSSSVSNSRRPSSALSQSLSERRASTSASSLRKREYDENTQTKEGKKRIDDDDDNLGDIRIPLYEEYLFTCNRWLAADEDDGLFVRELPVTNKTVYYKD